MVVRRFTLSQNLSGGGVDNFGCSHVKRYMEYAMWLFQYVLCSCTRHNETLHRNNVTSFSNILVRVTAFFHKQNVGSVAGSGSHGSQFSSISASDCLSLNHNWVPQLGGYIKRLYKKLAINTHYESI